MANEKHLTIYRGMCRNKRYRHKHKKKRKRMEEACKRDGMSRKKAGGLHPARETSKQTMRRESRFYDYGDE